MNFCLEIHYDTVTFPVKIQEGDDSATQNAVHSQIVKKPQKKNRHTKRSCLKENQYNWNDTQNRRYINFLVKHGHIMDKSVEEKKKFRVNVMMSKMIKSRTSTQCHTHHQKMIKKYSSVEKIIQEYAFLLAPKKIVQMAKVEDKLSVVEPIEQIMEIESQQIIRQSIWKEYLNPEIFFHESQQQFDNLFYF